MQSDVGRLGGDGGVALNRFAERVYGRILDTSVRTEKTLVFYTVDCESFTGAVVVLLPVDNEAHVIRLELELVQILVELTDRFLVRSAVFLAAYLMYFCFDVTSLGLCVSDAVQLVYPPKYLTVGEGNDLLVPTSLVYRQRELPLIVPQPCTVNFIDKLLTY